MKHLAVIMDGNGRYAVSRGLERTEGHVFGAKAFVQAVRDFLCLPIDVLTVYAFSTENVNRAEKEVSNILSIIAYFLEKEIYIIARENELSVRFVGNFDDLPCELKRVMASAPRYDVGKTLVIAINYGGLDEIKRTMVKIVAKNQEISEKSILDNLDIADLPFPDAVLRYGGYNRLSNFMPLQTAYSELFFTEKKWPEYEKKDFIEIIEKFEKIKRNFGGIND